jgi:hypothetical protein
LSRRSHHHHCPNRSMRITTASSPQSYPGPVIVRERDRRRGATIKSCVGSKHAASLSTIVFLGDGRRSEPDDQLGDSVQPWDGGNRQIRAAGCAELRCCQVCTHAACHAEADLLDLVLDGFGAGSGSSIARMR